MIESTPEELFYHNPMLMGNATFLTELSVDVSSFLIQLYLYLMKCYNEQFNITGEAEKLFNPSCIQHSIKRRYFYACDIYKNASNVMNRYFTYDSVSFVSGAILQIRQCIELRLWEILGIDEIIDDKNKPVKVTADRLLSLNGLKDNVKFHIEPSTLKKIHSWTNYYIHVGIAEEYWKIYFAYISIQDFVVQKPHIEYNYLNNLEQFISELLNNRNCAL